jgi:hypothetical protein
LRGEESEREAEAEGEDGTEENHLPGGLRGALGAWFVYDRACSLSLLHGGLPSLLRLHGALCAGSPRTAGLFPVAAPLGWGGSGFYFVQCGEAAEDGSAEDAREAAH